MGVRESWNELGTGGKVLVGLLVGGVVLVVGIVLLIVLAAVLGSFVLGMGSSASGGSAAAPPEMSVSMSYDATAETATVTHTRGETIEAENLLLRVDGELIDWTDPDGSVTAGDSMTVDASSGTRVRVIWSGGGEDPVTLASDTVGE